MNHLHDDLPTQNEEMLTQQMKAVQDILKNLLDIAETHAFGHCRLTIVQPDQEDPGR